MAASTPSKESPKSAVVVSGTTTTTTTATTVANDNDGGDSHTADAVTTAADGKVPPTDSTAAVATMATTTTTTSSDEPAATTKEAIVAPKDDAVPATESEHEPQQEPLVVLPTYERSKESESYQTALALLKEGLYDDAIQVLEEAIQELTQTLINIHQIEADDGHPSLAPFQYLYGSTLLYKIEDEEVVQNGTFPTTATNSNVTAPVAATDAAATAYASAPSGNDDDEEEYEPVVDTTTGEEVNGGQNYGEEEEEGDDVDDRQVAWECLELARTTLEELLQQQQQADDNHNNATPTNILYHSDLAQVRLRLGDLNKLNGLHAEAVLDYQESLQHLQSNPNTSSPHDRKVADLHFGIGQTLLLQAAAAAVNEEATESTTETLTPVQRSVLRSRAAYHLWQCSRGLAGYLALLCGVSDPPQFLDQIEQQSNDQGKANLKSTGDDDEDLQEHPTVVSHKLNRLREALTQVTPRPAPSATAASLAVTSSTALSELEAEIDDLMQLLGYIQETVDEAESAECGLQQVQHLKAEITAAAAGGALNSEDSNVGFGSAAAAASTAVAQPILVKKKMKKRNADEVGLPPNDQDSKRPAAE